MSDISEVLHVVRLHTFISVIGITYIVKFNGASLHLR